MDSLWWLNKHLGGYYTLLFFPCAVSSCSFSPHTIKASSLAGISRSTTSEADFSGVAFCDCLPLVMNEMVLLQAKREVFCLYWLGLSVYLFLCSQSTVFCEYLRLWLQYTGIIVYSFKILKKSFNLSRPGNTSYKSQLTVAFLSHQYQDVLIGPVIRKLLIWVGLRASVAHHCICFWRHLVAHNDTKW